VYACELPRRSRARNLILQHVLRHLRQAGLRPALPKSEAVDPAATHWQSERPTEVQMRHVLRSADLFLDLSDTELDLLARQARMQILPPDQTVVHAGEVGTAAYILVEGLLQSTRGRDTEATLLRPGDLFGAAAALLGDAHVATVRSRTSAMVCQLDMEAFQALFSHDPEAVRKVALRVAEIMKRDIEASGRGLALSVNVNEMAEDVLRTLRRTFSDVPVSGA
ncbi:MAG: cyclic nucleotide-binding domain-containing protein, partial [Rhodospirillales bacterium]|nr:cyclic nucleotide-binding domain-containing protein [Rhodospirillales bacterium]